MACNSHRTSSRAPFAIADAAGAPARKEFQPAVGDRYEGRR
jgi:hypothetical protein